MHWSRSILLCLSVAALTGCPSSNPHDAGADAHDGSIADATQDAEPPLTHSPFGNCGADADCPSSYTCITNQQGMPRGFCTKTCSGDADCSVDNTVYPGVSGVCGQINGMPYCQRACLNGIDCSRDGYTCTDLHSVSRIDPTAMSGECNPACDDTNCGPGAKCNHWSGQCEPLAAVDPPAGNDNGQACTTSGSSSECRSTHCILPVNATSHLPTGWNAGSCVGTCVVPAGYTVSDFWMPDLTLPQSNCPAHSVCIPGGDEAQGDYGNCFAECMHDTDCRASEGYYCRQTFSLGGPGHMRTKTYTNGWCMPVDCLNDSHHHCPTGYTCQMLVEQLGEGQTQNIGVCRPGDADAGTDAGTDAATDAATDTGPDATGDTDAAGDVVSDADGGLDE